MDFIAFDLESEFIFREFFARLSNLTIKKCGRGCRPCDEAKREKNKEGEPQQRFNHKTPCNCNLWPFCHKHISSKSLMESEPGMRKPGTWKASMRITSNLIWRTDAWFPELKTHLQVLICSVQHTYALYDPHTWRFLFSSTNPIVWMNIQTTWRQITKKVVLASLTPFIE